MFVEGQLYRFKYANTKREKDKCNRSFKATYLGKSGSYTPKAMFRRIAGYIETFTREQLLDYEITEERRRR